MDYMVLCACESFKNVHSIVFLCAKDVPKWPIDNLPSYQRRLQGRSVTKIWGRDEGKNINGWLQNAKQHGAFIKVLLSNLQLIFFLFCNLQPLQNKL